MADPTLNPSNSFKPSRDVVTVCCKYPPGILLRTFTMIPDQVSTPTGMRDIERAQQDPEAIAVAGPATDLGPIATWKPSLSSGFALTHGVPTALWNKWLEQNKDSALVKNGLIFAHAAREDVKAESKEKAGEKTGLEPVDPANPSAHTGLRKIEKGNTDPEK